MSKPQLYEILRSKKIFNLGKVKRMYLEACGIFSVYAQQDPKPGLPLFPEKDPAVLDHYQNVIEGQAACCNCGWVKNDHAKQPYCANCGNNEWTKAIV
jgi:uncharacterized membrane protein YcaP (DUF421 family)